MTYDNFHAWRKENGLHDLLEAREHMEQLREENGGVWKAIPLIVRQEYAALYEGMRALFFG